MKFKQIQHEHISYGKAADSQAGVTVTDLEQTIKGKTEYKD